MGTRVAPARTGTWPVPSTWPGPGPTRSASRARAWPSETGSTRSSSAAPTSDSPSNDRLRRAMPDTVRHEDRKGAGDFERRVRRVLLALRPGEVATYGEIAEEAGFPGAARAVGNVLAGAD